MHPISKIAVPAIALLSMVQYCPAPWIPLIATAAVLGGVSIDAGSVAGVIGAAAGVAGAVEGGLAAHHGRRDVEVREIEVKPRQFNSRIKRQDTSNLGLGTAWPDCHSQLGGAHLTFSAPSTGTVLVAGIPSACMTLCTVITGKYDEGNPVPMGTDSMSFSNLTDDDITQIQNALDVHPNKV